MNAPSVLVVHPSAELYGADRMLLESVHGLQEAGWRCTVVLPAAGPLAPLVERTGARVVVLPTPVVRKAFLSPTGVVRYALALARAAPTVWRLVQETAPEAVYVSTLTVPLWLAVARAAGVPAVCHVHEAEEGVPRPVRLALAAPLLLADAVLANSAASRQALVRELPRLSARTSVLYNGVPGPPRRLAGRTELHAPVRLVLVGRISPRKGTDVAVAALQQLVGAGHDVTLDLVGGVFPGYEWFEDEVRQQVAAADLLPRVRWLGELADPYAAMQAADIALVPSRVEPFGNTAVEAMLAGRPVVAARTQGLAEVVDPAHHGETTEPGDPTDLARAIALLLADWPRALRRASAAAVDAEQRFAPARYRLDVVHALAAAVERRSLSPARRRGAGRPAGVR